MNVIQKLSTSVVNKIAAGEVIERPASVVKELVENSIDAGATRIDVVVEKGGCERIRVTDNGAGISCDQLPLAVAAHATSKLRVADDLFKIASLGFRGEALASMAEVSRLTIRSRPRSAESGAELEMIGGQAEPIRPVGCPTGTSIEVRRLFFNTPVRQKFLKTTQTEMGHITETFTRLALACPQIHFTLVHGSRTLHDLAPVEDLQERIAALFGQTLADQLLSVESEENEICLTGYVANPMQSRSNNRMQYLLLNGRFIRDRSLQHALSEAYRGLLLSGRYPICFLQLQMPPAAVDVNVHPTKQEVRFQDASQLYSQLLATLRTKFLNSDLVAQATPPAGKLTVPGDPTLAGESSFGRQDEISRSLPASSELTDWACKQQPVQRADVLAKVPDYQPHGQSSMLHEGSLEYHRTDTPAQEATPHALQIHNRYLVTESEEGLEIIDQHALHERILYEQLREKVLAESLEIQRMLVPEPIDLTANEAAVVLENRQMLSRLGIEVEPFGGETILLTAYPAMLAHFNPVDLLHGLIEKLVEQLLAKGQPPSSRDLLDELLHTLACKAAVKYGDRLTSEEVSALVAERHLVQNHHHCPHGRPTTLSFTRAQLDRQFKRV